MNKEKATDITWGILDILEDLMAPGETWRQMFDDVCDDDLQIETIHDAFDYLYDGVMEGQGIPDAIYWIKEYTDGNEWINYKCAAMVQYLKDVITYD